MLLDMRRVLLNELDRCPNTAKELSELSETSAKQAVASSSVAFSDRTECSKAQVANSEMGSPTSSSKVSSPSKLSSYGAIVSKYQQMLAKAKAEKAAAKST